MQAFNQYATADGNNNIQEIVWKVWKKETQKLVIFLSVFFLNEACLSKNMKKRVSQAAEFRVASDY